MINDMRYYVYVHKYDGGDMADQVFYVGKGSGNRHSVKDRPYNKYWTRITRKYKYKSEILMRFNSEICAFSFEIALIKLYGRKNLCNLTDGGEGTSNPSAETRMKISDALSKRVIRDETRILLSKACKGREVSSDTRSKISKSLTGTKLSEETLDKLSLVRIGNKNRLGTKHDEKSREKMRNAKKGDNHPMWGKFHTDQTKGRISRTKKGVPMSESTKIKRSKPVETECGLRFYSITNAMEYLKENGFLNASKSSISACCHGKQRTAYGYVWLFSVTDK